MKKNVFIIIFVFLLSAPICQAAIKLYAFYTPSHEALFVQWFLPGIQDDFELVIERHEQECPSGTFMQKGWMKAMLRKVDLVIRGIKENWRKVFIHADIDIQFFKPFAHMIPELIGEKDMVIQKDDPRGQLCAGFFICRGNERTLKLWETIRERIIQNPTRHDQHVLNDIIRSSEPIITWDYLPDTFFGGGTLTGKGWVPGNSLEIPQDIILHHANWTAGIVNKVAQLKYVRLLVNARNRKIAS